MDHVAKISQFEYLEKIGTEILKRDSLSQME